ncbi:MAG: hypothetical protein HN472_10145 [Nitrospina sp.]|nr:hypothetical protein [Nitrospina sp.]MBT3509885.1 hypothetical protein [Nitrospina sp.]MBT3874483.1 hypothetical protein [Nitrospina sp.]MBT4049115.1 hypothetical protein [Nitrospina sp.]MBT4559153.1 hypothetical protein [Nitrospina sp.]
MTNFKTSSTERKITGRRKERNRRPKIIKKGERTKVAKVSTGPTQGRPSNHPVTRVGIAITATRKIAPKTAIKKVLEDLGLSEKLENKPEF